MRIVSTGAKLEQVEGLLGTRDLDERATGAVQGWVDRYKASGSTSWMTEKQLAWLERIWSEHFA